MASKEKMTGIRLSDEQNFKMREIAKRNSRKLNDEFRLMINKYIDEYEKINGKIEIIEE